MKYFLIFLFFYLPAHCINESQLKEVAFSKEWLKLLHYLPSGNGYESQLDGTQFFFAKDGKTNPFTELKASIEQIAKKEGIGPLKLKALCAFPERSRFLKEKFQLEYPPVKCEYFEKFMAKFHNPTGVSLVFSSAYPNNPASMFGHTFLKIESSRTSELLDIGVNFAAYTPKDFNMLVFMYKGVFGGYPGVWSIDPYFKKVNEYINSESRDLWEYRLNLSAEDTKKLLAHFWELEVSSYFDYYFFDENCSYQILTAIEAIRPDLHLTDYKIYVIPGETVKNLKEVPGFITDVKFRPSLFHQTQLEIAALDSEGQKNAIAWIHGIENDDKRPEVIGAALTGSLYMKAKKKTLWKEKDQAWENKLLSLQASNNKAVSKPSIPEKLLGSEPSMGHDPYAIFLELGSSAENKGKHRNLGKLKIRSAYHDLMANDSGYATFSEIEFPSIELKYQQDKLRVHEVGFINTISLFPLSKLETRKSWKVNISLQTEPIDPCRACLVPQIEAGFGLSLGNDNYRAYSMAIVNFQVHRKLNYGSRWMPGLEAGWYWRINNKQKTRLIYRYLRDLSHKNDVTEGIATHSYQWRKNQEFRQEVQVKRTHSPWNQKYVELGFQYIRYFR